MRQQTEFISQLGGAHIHAGLTGDRGNVDGLNRFQRRAVRIADRAVIHPSSCAILALEPTHKMTTQNYKNIITGSGEGGKYLAWHLAQSGEQTVVIERRWIGGSWPNVNCLSSKNEIWSANVAHLVHNAARFGSPVTDHPSDMAAVRKRKREMVEGLIALHLDKYRASGAELVMGEARFASSNMLEVRLNDGGTRTLVGERIFLNLGTHATIPSVR